MRLLSRHDRLIAALLLLAAVRTWADSLRAPPSDLLDPAVGPPSVLPDLSHDGWVRLNWLPGIGGDRARRIVALRPFLGVRLTPQRLALLPGFGGGIADEVAAWYARGGRSPPVGSREGAIYASGRLAAAVRE